MGNGFDFSHYVVMGDLTDAALILPEDLWTKPDGIPAALEMIAEQSSGGGLEISRLAVLGEDVDIRGQASLAPDGQLLDANFETVVIGGRADLSVMADRPDGSEGALNIVVGGRFLDATDLISNLMAATARANSSCVWKAPAMRRSRGQGAALSPLCLPRARPARRSFWPRPCRAWMRCSPKGFQR